MSDQNDTLRFTDEDRRSAAWLKLTRYLEARLQGHRETNDAQLGEAETARLRGRIAEIKALLGAAAVDQDEQEDRFAGRRATGDWRE